MDDPLPVDVFEVIVDALVTAVLEEMSRECADSGATVSSPGGTNHNPAPVEAEAILQL